MTDIVKPEEQAEGNILRGALTEGSIVPEIEKDKGHTVDDGDTVSAPNSDVLPTEDKPFTDIVKPEEQAEGNILRGALTEGSIVPEIEKDKGHTVDDGDTVSAPNSDALPTEDKPFITCEEKFKVMELLNKVSAILRDTSSKFLKEEIPKVKSTESPRSMDLDREKMKRDLDELLKSSGERGTSMKNATGKTDWKSIFSYSDLIPKEVEECLKKLELDEFPVPNEVDSFVRKMDPMLQKSIYKDDPETGTESKEVETESVSKKETPVIEDVDFAQKPLSDLVMDLQNITSKELKDKLFKEVDKKLAEETDELMKLIDSLEISIKSKSEVAKDSSKVVP